MDVSDESKNSEDEVFHVDDNDHLSMDGSGVIIGVDDINSAIPLGLWPCILEAAHKQFPDVSMLHHLLLSQMGDLILFRLRREE
jgi:hypothetical protein